MFTVGFMLPSGPLKMMSFRGKIFTRTSYDIAFPTGKMGNIFNSQVPEMCGPYTINMLDGFISFSETA